MCYIVDPPSRQYSVANEVFLEFPNKNVIILVLAIASWVGGGICKLYKMVVIACNTGTRNIYICISIMKLMCWCTSCLEIHKKPKKLLFFGGGGKVEALPSIGKFQALYR